MEGRGWGIRVVCFRAMNSITVPRMVYTHTGVVVHRFFARSNERKGADTVCASFSIAPFMNLASFRENTVNSVRLDVSGH